MSKGNKKDHKDLSDKEALKATKKGENVKIYGRVRNLMPWEPRKISLSTHGNLIRNTTVKTTNEYSFNKVFNMDIVNIQIFQIMVQPMIDNVLAGFNAVLIAYGQTGSGKTFTMLGKPKLNVVGVLPYMLKELVENPRVYKLELGAVEAFGHHVARIELFDLFDPKNQVPVWTDKKGNTSLVVQKSGRVPIRNIDEAYSQIRYAHAASHFAMTGKNPESSRGHVTFLSTVYQTGDESMDLVSHFVMLDCAGSEGESAFTDEFKKSVTKEVLMARRLEAGCINTGLCQLQIIFNELRVKGMLSKMEGNGLRKVLHGYINTRTVLAVIFTFSPSVNNAKATESTLKFAVTAGMVKVKPVKEKLKVNLDKLVLTLRKHIEENDKILEEQEDEIMNLTGKYNTVKEGGIAGGHILAGGDDEYDDGFGLGEEMEEYIDEQGNFQVRRKERSRKKEKFNNALSKKLKNKLSMLDDDSDSGFDLDDDFKGSNKYGINEKELDKQMKLAVKANARNADARNIVLGATGYDLGDAKGRDELDHLIKENEEKDLEDLAAEAEGDEMMAEMQEAMPDYSAMSVNDLQNNIKEDFSCIKTMKEEQEKLKESQAHVVDHLVETNEWLFNSLQEILEQKIV